MVKVLFEELRLRKRAGGIEAATAALVQSLSLEGVSVTRGSHCVKRGVPDLVHVHGIWSPILALRLARWRRKGIPVAVSPHGMLDSWALSQKAAKKRVAWWVYQRALLDRGVVLHGTSMREVAQFRYLRLRARVALVPWGVSLPDIGEISTAEQSPRVALFVGRICPSKGLPVLVEAWARVRPVGWRLVIAGPDERGHQAEVYSLVRMAGLAGDVEFAGPLSGAEKAAAFRRAELFIMPSHTENFGLAIAEALSYSVPVLTTQGTPWSIIRSNDCGWWVPATAQGVADGLRNAVGSDTPRLRAMGQRGRILAEREFNWRDSARKLRSVYEWMVGRGTKPAYVS